MRNKKCVICGCVRKVVMFQWRTPLCNKHYIQQYRHGKVLERTRLDANKIIKKGHVCEILLYSKNQSVNGVAIVDSNLVDEVKKYKWHKNSEGYVCSHITGQNKQILKLHHLIAGRKLGCVVDHINRNRLDNRMANLRYLTVRENNQNKSHYVYKNKKFFR